MSFKIIRESLVQGKQSARHTTDFMARLHNQIQPMVSGLSFGLQVDAPLLPVTKQNKLKAQDFMTQMVSVFSPRMLYFLRELVEIVLYLWQNHKRLPL